MALWRPVPGDGRPRFAPWRVLEAHTAHPAPRYPVLLRPPSLLDSVCCPSHRQPKNSRPTPQATGISLRSIRTAARAALIQAETRTASLGEKGLPQPRGAAVGAEDPAHGHRLQTPPRSRVWRPWFPASSRLLSRHACRRLLRTRRGLGQSRGGSAGLQRSEGLRRQVHGAAALGWQLRPVFQHCLCVIFFRHPLCC